MIGYITLGRQHIGFLIVLQFEYDPCVRIQRFYCALKPFSSFKSYTLENQRLE